MLPTLSHEAIQLAGAPAVAGPLRARRRWRLVLRAAYRDWQRNDATRLAAALAYHTLFSLAPLLLIATAIVGALFGDKAVSGELHRQLEDSFGSDGAGLVEDLVARARQPHSGILASVIGVATLLWGASNLFGELKDALNRIWDLRQSADRGWRGTVYSRLWLFFMLLSVGFLLVGSLVLD